MKKNNKNKKSLLLVFAILFATAVTGALVSTTYAKYISKLNAEATDVSVAKWAFEEDNKETSFGFTLNETYDANTLTAGKIAPGTSGSFEIELSNTTSDVAVDYAVSFTTDNLPTTLNLYSDAEHTQALSDELTGSLNIGATDTVTVYWAWDYSHTDPENDIMIDQNDNDIDDLDDTDTYYGIAAAEGAKISATVVGTQSTRFGA